MHAPFLRGDSKRERRRDSLPMSRRFVRAEHRPQVGRATGATAAARDAQRAGGRHLRHRRGAENRMSIKRQFTREQRTTIIYGMLTFILMLVILQLWLLTATMNAYLGGDEAVIWPAAGASIFCLLLNLGLLRYLYQIERVRR